MENHSSVTGAKSCFSVIDVCEINHIKTVEMK